MINVWRKQKQNILYYEQHESEIKKGENFINQISKDLLASSAHFLEKEQDTKLLLSCLNESRISMKLDTILKVAT